MIKKNFKINDLGFDKSLNEYRVENNLNAFGVGRVILEHKERYVVLNEQGEFECELIGNLRYTAQSRSDLPAVGDWVAFSEYDKLKGLIHAIYPRKNVLERQAVGRNGEKQIIATNIDFGLIVQSVNRDFSINRLERYLAICHTSKIEPVVVLNKTDLVEKEELEKMISDMKSRIDGTEVIPISNLTGEGLDLIKPMIRSGKTYCLLGSSGVGKSTLINSLIGSDVLETGDISESIDRGKHVTTHRELILLETGGAIIDNPGMREVGMTENAAGLETTFELIHDLAHQCKFNDCSHQNEKGCAIISAIESGELSEETYENFMKLQREQAHFSAAVHAKRKKEKAFGKMIKQVVNQKYGKRS